MSKIFFDLIRRNRLTIVALLFILSIIAVMVWDFTKKDIYWVEYYEAEQQPKNNEYYEEYYYIPPKVYILNDTCVMTKTFIWRDYIKDELQEIRFDYVKFNKLFLRVRWDFYDCNNILVMSYHPAKKKKNTYEKNRNIRWGF